MTDIFRILVVVFLAMHGIGHIIWFLAAWTPIRAGVRHGPWALPGKVTIRSPIGRVLGLVALGCLVVFVAAALALFAQEPAWRPLTNIGILLSFIAVVPWLRQSPGTAPIIANLVLLFLLALPLSAELIPAP